MKTGRSAIVVISVLILSTVVFIGGVLSSPVFQDKDPEGDWYLTWADGHSSDGTDVSDVFEPSSLLRISVSGGGTMNGTMNGFSLVGTYGKSILRFSLDMPAGTAQMMGIISIRDVLNVVAVIHDGGSYGSYSLLFTRDSVLPSMIEEIQTDMTGRWVTGAVGGSGSVQDVSMTVASQNSSIAHGTMDLDGDRIGFCLAVSMIKNTTMNTGLLVSEDGTFWIISVKKGLVIMHSASVSGNGVLDEHIYLVRNPGNIFVHVPTVLDNGDVWKGTKGFDQVTAEVTATGYEAEITEQKDGRISGKIGGGPGCEFVGVIFSSGPIAAELTIVLDGREVRATLFVIDDTMYIVAFSGLLFDNMISMVFAR